MISAENCAAGAALLTERAHLEHVVAHLHEYETLQLVFRHAYGSVWRTEGAEISPGHRELVGGYAAARIAQIDDELRALGIAPPVRE